MGCPLCKTSKGEKKIKEFLEKNNIDFISSKKFNDLKDINLLSCDFYLPELNLLIEYNGEQHYKQNIFDKTWEEFLIQKYHDWLKRKYAKNSNIKLLIVPYWNFDNIEKILEESL